MRPIISPRTFDHYFAPSYKRMIEMIREAVPGCKILFHSDGNMEPFMSRLISLGIDIYHGVEPLPGVDFLRLKEEYGNQICFWGGIDVHGAMMGSEPGVVEEIITRINQLAGGGGYVLAPVNHLQPDTPPENVIALFEYARKLGQRNN
jgi:uroporphyrinogen decarboxylase